MAKRMKATPYLPLELVAAQILLRLPIESLLRFTCVCKAWRDLIAGDSSFHRAHLRLQNSCLLIAPQIESNSDDGCWPPELNAGLKTVGFYRWEQSHKDDATPVHAMPDSFSLYRETIHDLAHCDGLVLVPANAADVRVVNPATRRVRTLPRSTHILKPRMRINDQHAFGLGHDPRSNTYKVARFFYKSRKCTSMAGHHAYTLGMEVYTLGGADQQQRQWRETATPPPYPVIPGRTATFFKGSLFWTIKEFMNTIVAPGFVRFSLEDESFSVMPPPPCRHRIDYAASSLAELRGELCLCVPRPDGESLEIWMCHDLDRWDRRHVIAPVVASSSIRTFFPVVADADAIVFRARSDLVRCDRNTQQTSLKNYIAMDKLRHHDHPDTYILVQCQRESMFSFMVVPYIPSQVSIPNVRKPIDIP